MIGWVIGCDSIMGDFFFFPIFHNCCYYRVNNDIPHDEDDEKDPKTNNPGTVNDFPYEGDAPTLTKSHFGDQRQTLGRSYLTPPGN